MAAVIWSTAVATVFTFSDMSRVELAICCMLTDISSAAEATVPDCWVVSSAPRASSPAVDDNSPEAVPSFSAQAWIWVIIPRSRPVRPFTDRRSCPTSSSRSTDRVWVRLPWAKVWKAATVSLSGRVTSRVTRKKNRPPAAAVSATAIAALAHRLAAAFASAWSSD